MRVATVVAAAALGLLAGLALPRPAPVPAAPARCPGLDLAGLRSVVRAAVAAELARGARSPVAPAPAPTLAASETEAAPPTDEEVAAEEEATRLVDAARARRRWEDADAASLRRLLASMTAPQRQDVLGRLVRAVNAQELAVEPASLF